VVKGGKKNPKKRGTTCRPLSKKGRTPEKKKPPSKTWTIKEGKTRTGRVAGCTLGEKGTRGKKTLKRGAWRRN